MKTRMLLLVVAFCAASALGRAAYAQAKDEKKPAAAAQPAEKPATAAKPADPHAAHGGPDMAKMMEAWKKSATPGEYHAKLNPLVGKWTFVTKARMTPEEPFHETKGKGEYRWGLGKRFLYHEVKAEPSEHDAMMGGPFEGFGFTGFDNGTQKYFNIWTDNMSTTYMASTGSVDSSGKTFTYNSEDGYICPMTGQKKTPRTVLKIAGDDKLVFEMYDKGPDGKEFMSLEVTYTRQK